MPKKAANTNKTAHVMNLISKNTAAAPAAPVENLSAEPEQTPAPAAATASAAVPPSLNADAEITSQIKSALEGMLEEEPSVGQTASESPAEPDKPAAPPVPEQPLEAEPVTAPKPQPVSLTEPVTAPEMPEMPEQPVAAAPVMQEEPVVTAAPVTPEEPTITAEPVTQEEPTVTAKPATQEEPTVTAAPVTQEEPAMTEAPAESEKTVCFNIMQALVEESVHKYIKMFGLCDCSRCVEDVKAIALNNLVPKYIVAPEKEQHPRVIIYNERYHAEVTAQILRACQTVMNEPRHN